MTNESGPVLEPATVVCEPVCEPAPDSTRAAGAGAPPFGRAGSDTASVCRCGAGPHPEREDRCAAGHVVPGNRLAVVTGSRSAAFWTAHEHVRGEIQRDV